MRGGDRRLGSIALHDSHQVLTWDETELGILQVLADQVSALLQVNRLLLETTSSYDLIERQTQAFQELNVSMDFEAMVLTVARHMLPTKGRFLGISRFVYDGDDITGWQILATANRERAYRWAETPIMDWKAVGAGLRKSVVEGRPYSVISAEYLPPDEDSPELHALLQANGVTSYLSIPLLVDSRPVASLFIMSRSETRFTHAEINAFRTLADQISALIHARTLLEEAHSTASQLTQQVNYLQQVNEITALIAAATDEKTLLDRTTESLVKLLGIDHSGIVLVNPGERYGIVASEYPKQGAEGISIDTTHNPLWDEQRKNDFQPMVVQNAETDERIEPSTREAFKMLGIKAIALLPVVVRDQIIGGIGLDVYTPDRSFTAEMLDSAQIIAVQFNVSLQNVRLLHEVQSSAARLNVKVKTLQQLAELEARITAATDEGELLDEAVQGLCDLLQVDHTGLVLLDQSKTVATLASEYPDRGLVGKVQFSVVGNPLFDFIREADKDPVVINDLENDPRLSDVNRRPLQEIGVKAVTILPLVVQGEVIGSVGADIYSDDQQFTPERVETAQTVASQLALALQNIRLLNEAQHRAQQLQRIAVFSEAAQADLDVEVILRLMLTEIDRMLMSNQFSINLYDMRTRELRVVAERIDGSNKLTMSTGEVIPITGHIARAWSSQQPLYIPDLRQSPHEMDPGMMLRSWLLVPVIAHGLRRGIITVGSNQPSAYSETDITLFTQLVNHFATILDNTESYQQSRRAARNEALVNEISTQLQRQLDLPSMLNITATELGKAIRARRARVRLGTEAAQDESGAE